MARGNNSQAIFRAPADFQRYLELLAGYVRVHRLSLHHFALLPDRVHLLMGISTGLALSKSMLGLSLAYTLYYHKRYQTSGHLWQGRFKSVAVEPERRLELARWIELEPVRGGLVQDPAQHPWSSYPIYAHGLDISWVTPNPAYQALGSMEHERQQRYRDWVLQGIDDKKEALNVRSPLTLS
jgi:putative transposase